MKVSAKNLKIDKIIGSSVKAILIFSYSTHQSFKGVWLVLSFQFQFQKLFLDNSNPLIYSRLSRCSTAKRSSTGLVPIGPAKVKALKVPLK